MDLNLHNLCECFARDAEMFCKRIQCQNKVAKNSLIQCEDLFLDNTSFGDGNFCTNSHDNITLIVSAIAARAKLRDKNLTRDEQKVGHP